MHSYQCTQILLVWQSSNERLNLCIMPKINMQNENLEVSCIFDPLDEPEFSKKTFTPRNYLFPITKKIIH